MKVTLDLSRLLENGQITRAEHDRLLALGGRETGTVLVNALVAFGAVAVVAGVLALLPSWATGTVLGAGLLAAGVSLSRFGPPAWSMLATIGILLGALLGGGGFLAWTQDAGGEGPPWLDLRLAVAAVALLLALCAVPARSALLAAAATLLLFWLLGSGTGYGHASYSLSVTRPVLTAAFFSVLALGTYVPSRRVGAENERLLLTVARVSLFLVNLAFWIGSLWGDELRGDELGRVAVPRLAFSVAWAVLLVGAGLWAGRANRRWVVNLVATFGGIHFYTQWFEHLGADPLSLLAAGLLLLVFAGLLVRINRASPAVP